MSLKSEFVISCDVCGNKDYSPTNESANFDEGFDGWVRLSANKPYKYKYHFMRNDENKSDIFGSVDCCSISCARDYLTGNREDA